MPYVINNGVKIHYQVDGQGFPLMLLHGFGSSIDSWQQSCYVRELKNDYRLILVDIRGFGASDKPHDSSAYGFWLLIGDLVAVLDELNVDKANFFGYSMGGQIGYRIPDYAPQRFSSLIIGAAAYPKDSTLIQINDRLKDAVRESPENPMEYYANASEKPTSKLSSSVRAELLSNDAWALLACTDMLRSEICLKAEEILPKITIPSLLIVGEADSRFPAVRDCAALIAGARFVSLPDLNHVQIILQGEVIVPHIRRFLDEVKAK